MKSVEKVELKLITIYGNIITVETDEDNIDDVLDRIIDNLDSNEVCSVGPCGETVTFKNHE